VGGMILPNDIARCVGRNALTPDSPICPRREQCARYVALLEHPKGETCMTPIAMHLCSEGDDYMIEVRYTITAKGRELLEGTK
jgi:hypothetical protein